MLLANAIIREGIVPLVWNDSYVELMAPESFYTQMINLCFKHVLQQFLLFPVWFCYLIALLCLSADSFREVIAFHFSLSQSSFYLSHFMWIADEIFSQLNVCRAWPRYAWILLREHYLKKGILFAICSPS